MKKIYSVLLLCLSTLLLTIIQADTTADTPPDADFLEFLAEVDEATGEGFETWLNTINSDDTTNNLTKNIINDTQTNNAQTDKE